MLFKQSLNTGQLRSRSHYHTEETQPDMEHFCGNVAALEVILHVSLDMFVRDDDMSAISDFYVKTSNLTFYAKANRNICLCVCWDFF